MGPLASRCQSSSSPSSSVPCRPQLCQAVKPLPTCRLFRDVSWTLFHNDNHTSQVVKCACPADTMAYITTIEKTETGQAYHFGCSPEIVGASFLFLPLLPFTDRLRAPVLLPIFSPGARRALCACLYYSPGSQPADAGRTETALNGRKGTASRRAKGQK